MAHGQESESPCPLGADRWRGTHLRELARTTGVYLGPEYGATALKNTYTYHRSARILSSTQSETTNRPRCPGADRARGRPWLISGAQHGNTRTTTCHRASALETRTYMSAAQGKTSSPTQKPVKHSAERFEPVCFHGVNGLPARNLHRLARHQPPTHKDNFRCKARRCCLMQPA